MTRATHRIRPGPFRSLERILGSISPQDGDHDRKPPNGTEWLFWRRELPVDRPRMCLLCIALAECTGEMTRQEMTVSGNQLMQYEVVKLTTILAGNHSCTILIKVCDRL